MLLELSPPKHQPMDEKVLPRQDTLSEGMFGSEFRPTSQRTGEAFVIDTLEPRREAGGDD